MSNILKTIEYLKKNPENRFLMLTNLENNQKVGKSNIFFNDIPEEDLNRYIKSNLGEITKPTLVWVELRVKQGASSKKEDAYKVEINPVINVPQTVSNLMPAVQTVQPMLPQVQVPQPQPDFFNGGLGQSFGLGLPQIMEMNRKADRLQDKEEQLSELKDDFKEVKQENRLLEIENRELKTKLSTSEAKQEMAVMMVKAENKSFFDSPAFEKMMDKAPELLSGFVAMKTGGVPTGALGAGLTEVQSSFIEYVTENLTDTQLNFLGAVAGNINNEMFMGELQQLIARYATN